MKKALLAALALTLAGGASAQILPFSDDFESGTPNSAWDADTAANYSSFNNGTLQVVSSDTDWRGVTINPPADGGSNFAEIEFAATTFATAWRVIGDGSFDGTLADYQVSCDMYVPVIDSTLASANPDDYLYQSVIGAAQPAYTRAHFHIAEGGVEPTAPRIRIQTTYGGFQTPYNQPTVGFTEGWKQVDVIFDNTNATVDMIVDGVSVNGGPLAIPAAEFANGGGFGVGMYVNGDTTSAPNGVNGPRSLYFDNFSATAIGANVNDWVVYN